MHQSAFGGRAPPGPAGGAYSAYSAPQDSLAGSNGEERGEAWKRCREGEWERRRWGRRKGENPQCLKCADATASLCGMYSVRASVTALRGHDYKLMKRHCRSHARLTFFSFRLVTLWDNYYRVRWCLLHQWILSKEYWTSSLLGTPLLFIGPCVRL